MMMKKKKLFALLMAIVMLIGLTACGNKDSGEDMSGGEEGSGLNLGYDSATGETFYGPYYDEWSEKSDEELYEMAKEEVSNGAKKIVVYATSSKMTKVKDDFIEAYPELELEVIDLDSDEVLSKAEIENDSGNINADVLQSKDVNGEVFFEHYEKGVLEPYYPKDICSHIDEANLKYSFPLYASQAFWYYNTGCLPRKSVRKPRICPCLPVSSTMPTRWRPIIRSSTAKTWSTPMTPAALSSKCLRITRA